MKALRILLLAAVFAGFAGQAFAETYPGPHEAGPGIYKQVFDNEQVRVSEVTFEQGVTIPMHHHSYGHSLYILEGGQLTITYPDGTSAVVDAKAGDVMLRGVEDHSAKNTGSTTVRVLVTEVKSAV